MLRGGYPKLFCIDALVKGKEFRLFRSEVARLSLFSFSLVSHSSTRETRQPHSHLPPLALSIKQEMLTAHLR